MTKGPAMNVTTYTAQILNLAAVAGMDDVTVLDSDDPRVLRLWLNSHSWDAPFAIVYIGRASGRVLRANIKYGNDGRKREFGRAVDFRRELARLAG